MDAFFRNDHALARRTKALDDRCLVEIDRRNHRNRLDRQFVGGRQIIRVERDPARRAFHVLGFDGAIPHFGNCLIFAIDRSNHLGQHKTKRHLRVIALQRTHFTGFGDDRHLDLATQLPANIPQGADAWFQPENTTATLTVKLDLPGQIAVRINPLLLPGARYEKRQNKRRNNKRNDGKGKLHGSPVLFPGSGLCHSPSPESRKPRPGPGLCMAKSVSTKSCPVAGAATTTSRASTSPASGSTAATAAMARRPRSTR